MVWCVAFHHANTIIRGANNKLNAKTPHATHLQMCFRPAVPRGPIKRHLLLIGAIRLTAQLLWFWWQKPTLKYNSAPHQLLEENIAIILLFSANVLGHNYDPSRRVLWFRGASSQRSVFCLSVYNHTQRKDFSRSTFMRLNSNVLNKLLPSLSGHNHTQSAEIIWWKCCCFTVLS